MPALLLLPVMMSALFFISPQEVFGAETDTDQEVRINYAEDNFENIREINIPFVDTETVVYEWKFPYTDEFFNTPSSEFSRTMAQGSLGIAVSTFRSTLGIVGPQYETYLRQAGFTNIFTFGYDKPTTANSLSGVIASKQIGDFTVIAAACCGQGYGHEWGGNLKVGSGDVHEGFKEAAGILEKHLTDYILRYKIDGKKKLWLSGYSRASAVANITAADAIRSGDYADVYSYGFGVPRTTKKPVAYPGIYNICGQYDPVPQAPLQCWGFERYGTDLFTPSEEADTEYSALAASASNVSRKLTGNPFRNNPELNYQYRLILGFMGELFEDNKEYSEEFQDILMETWKTPSFENFESVLTTAVGKLKDLSLREKNSTQIFIDYMTMIAGEHTRANQRQIKDGSWNPDEPIAANMVLEHRPATYVIWMFADNETDEVLRTEASTRRIAFEGNFAMKVYQDDMLIQSIDRSGNLIYTNDLQPSGADNILPEYYMIKDGKNSVINVPADSSCRIELFSASNNPLVYYDTYFGTRNLKGSAGNVNISLPTKGTFALDLKAGQTLPGLEAIDGKVGNYNSEKYAFSSANLMEDEVKAKASYYMSKDKIIAVVLVVVNCMNLLLLICLILFIVHFKKRKSGYPTYSDWYVIVPHLIVIAVFTWLTMFVRYYLITISQAWCECAAVTVFVIFLLALRGHIRYRNLQNAATAAVLFVLTIMLQLFGDKLAQYSFTIVTVIVFCGVITGLTLLAVLTFFREQDKTQISNS